MILPKFLPYVEYNLPTAMPFFCLSFNMQRWPQAHGQYLLTSIALVAFLPLVVQCSSGPEELKRGQNRPSVDLLPYFVDLPIDILDNGCPEIEQLRQPLFSW